jgi:hypothetical protein
MTNPSDAKIKSGEMWFPNVQNLFHRQSNRNLVESAIPFLGEYRPMAEPEISTGTTPQSGIP